jgi:hypothetical protein
MLTVTFRPTFNEASIDKYPGGQRFLLADVIQPSVIDRSVSRLRAEQYCGADAVGANLRGRFLSPVHPTGNEVRVTRPIFQLVFEPGADCAALPDDVALRLLSGILAEWATDAVERRGVLNSSKIIMSPQIFTYAMDSSVFVRADRVREAILLVLGDVEQFKQQPGADMVRVADLTVDVLQFRLRGVLVELDRFIVASSAAGGASGRHWLNEALATAEIAQRAAKERADSRRLALHEYASAAPATVLSNTDVPQDGRDQLKQELTREFITASEIATRNASMAARYRALRAAALAQRVVAAPSTVLEKRLDGLVREAGEITADFNRLYNLFSETRIGDQGLLYRIEQGPEIVMAKRFGLREFLFLLTGVAFGSIALMAVSMLLRKHWRWLFQSKTARSTGAE